MNTNREKLTGPSMPLTRSQKLFNKLTDLTEKIPFEFVPTKGRGSQPSHNHPGYKNIQRELKKED